MKAEQNNRQSDWLDRAEELKDVDASQTNGGSSISDSLNGLVQQLQQKVNGSSTPSNSPSTSLTDALNSLKSNF